MTPIFNTNREYLKMHVLVQICWFQLKSVTSYRADKVKFTDGRTDGRTDGETQATSIPLRPERPMGNNTEEHLADSAYSTAGARLLTWINFNHGVDK